ncbi:raffinose/stachyose/melibiose transport system substrate-binding protein [Pseudoclavibacter sp. JAI123]|uniref:ABC transporter substrate-binding protein n=1 Tax=Pseudoclavibacter sp. JAI123 TaxID=2723065 RepID=UPI0015CE57BB|nr:extracellular solute-binding protein [Pseudoclavibacter sp. JAI123]NYF14913.1 raffinose/stachyose/melibiose transport system substrate-binding protein [Pseudoclavibacter sp. JAI123]
MSHSRNQRMRLSAALALPVAGVLVLSGCAGGGDGGGTGEGGATEFSLTYATSNNFENPYEALANAYMEANPDVKITLNPQPNDRYGETLRTQLQAGNAPDVIQTAPGAGQGQAALSLAEAGFLAPLDDAVSGVLPEGQEALFTYEDQIVAQPVDFTVSGFVYSNASADAAGISSFPADAGALVGGCSTLTGEGKSMIALAGAAGPNTGMTALSISASRVYADTPDWNDQRTAGDVTFADSQGWKDTLQTVVDLNEAGCFQAGSQGAGFDVITNNITQGTSLGAFLPGSAVPELLSANPDLDFTIEAFPSEAGKKPGVLASSNYALSVNAASEKQEAAQAFLDWVAQPEGAKIFSDVSGALPITGLEDFQFEGTAYSGVEELLKNGEFTALPISFWPNPSVYEALQTGVQGLLTGQTNVDGVLASMDAAWG